MWLFFVLGHFSLSSHNEDEDVFLSQLKECVIVVTEQETEAGEVTLREEETCVSTNVQVRYRSEEDNLFDY